MVYAGTFSVVGYDAATQACGIAISSAMPAVGSLCVFADPDRGAIATQAWVNPLLGVDGLELLATHSGQETLARLLSEDPEPEMRQLALVTTEGESAAHTGSETHPWSGHRCGSGYATAGNILVGEETIAAMATEFTRTIGASLPERLLGALESGQEAGGDRRGRQSAALYVVQKERYPYVDLRVDEHPDPVAELRRIYDIARQELFPFIEALATRNHPAGKSNDTVAEPGATRGKRDEQTPQGRV